jgi:predicted permease
MRWADKLWLRIRSLFLPPQVERELDAELRFHLEKQIQENLAVGVSPEEARLAALRAIGGIAQFKEECRDMRGVNLIENLVQDLRYAVRMLRKSPGFTAVVVLSLALGIGANTAIFSLIDALLLRMLPVRNPQQLVVLRPMSKRGEEVGFSYPLFVQVRDRTQVFSGILAAANGAGAREMVRSEPGGRPERASVQLVSGEYFQVLGVKAFMGRVLAPADDRTPGAHPLAVISYAFWERRFAHDFSAVGKRITLDGQPFTVIGVASPEFFGEEVGQAPDMWVPLTMQPTFDRGMSRLDQPSSSWLHVIARTEPGVSEARTRAALTVFLAQLQAEPDDLGKDVRGLSRLDLQPGDKGVSDLRIRFSRSLEILMAVTGLLLLIACANVASLLLARSSARQKEIGVRLAIGAGRGRLVRQLLTESTLLAFAGGAIGVLFAYWSSRVLLVFVSGGPSPIPIDVAPNPRVLGFAIVVSLLTGILFGLAPALQSSRQDLNTALKISSSAAGAASTRNSLLRTVVMAQVALSLLLLTGAGLFVRTLRNLRTLDLGFATEHVLQAQITPQWDGYKGEQLPDFYTRLLERLRSTPGVLSASMADTGFRNGRDRLCCIAVEGRAIRADEDRRILTNGVTPGFFATMGIPLLLGRDFNAHDVGKGRFQVAIINETMARYYFGKANPLGRRFGFWGFKPKSVYDTEIIGVVKDVRYGNLRDAPPRLIYYPRHGGNTIEARVAGDSAAMASALRRAIQDVDKNLRIFSVDPIPQIVERALTQDKLVAKLSGFFGLLALLLAGIGLYGVMAYAVARRTQEIGIRMALGAQRQDVVWLILRETLTVILIGAAIGAPAAAASALLIRSQLFGISPTDPLTLSAAVILLTAVAALAGYLPARRAARIDPMIALRSE